MTEDIDFLVNYTNETKELTINPFGLDKVSCNNCCTFCIVKERMLNQDISLQHFKEVANNTINWINKYKNYFSEDITICIFCVAGELYAFNKEYYDLFKETLTSIYETCSTRWKKVIFKLQSNFIFNKEEYANNLIDLMAYLEKLNNCIPQLTTSFDMYSRFNEEKLSLWKNTVDLVVSKIKNRLIIETLLLQPSIERYLYSEDNLTKTFDYLLSNPDKFDLSLEDFILNNEANKDLYPKTEDLISFYKKIDSKFPNHPIITYYKNPVVVNNSNTKLKNECVLIHFATKPINTELMYTTEDLRVVNKNCIGESTNNLYVTSNGKGFKRVPTVKGLLCQQERNLIDDYFGNVVGCNFCKYKPYCKAKCYVQYLPKYKSDKCQIKELYKTFSK